ncbi:MIF4G domain-containing protein [Caenorhabditis elegans]|uniref:MIF4G domain-containing protein n=1 Tax=Caenorhabditis elegans TaxID=6239 RepID=Q21531_CAEEL|nr:MIF4G domain-containing protein [Caenorhabditis elegans]CAA90261.1 MIF4G domain-containing protein [Caenorhabditis elegans]|eukprot:NP_001022259.1 Initiation Factor 4G (eIF4G) family [Caenorhabditis elegans]
MSNAVSRGPGRGKPNQDHNAVPMQDSSQQFVMPFVNTSGPVNSNYQRMPMNQSAYPQYGQQQYNQPQTNHYYPPQAPQHQQQYGGYQRPDYGHQPQMYNQQYQGYQAPQQYHPEMPYQPAQPAQQQMTHTAPQEPKRQRKALEIVDPTTKKAIEVTPHLAPAAPAPAAPAAPIAPEEEKKKQNITLEFLNQVKNELHHEDRRHDNPPAVPAAVPAAVQAAVLPNFSVPPPALGQTPPAASIAPQVVPSVPKTPEAPAKADYEVKQAETLVTPVSSPHASDTTTTTPASGTAESASTVADVRVTPTLTKEESKEETDDDKFEENDERESTPDVADSSTEKTPEELEIEKAQKEAEEIEKKKLREEALEKRIEELILAGSAVISDGTFGRDFMVTIREIEKVFSRTPCPLSPAQLADFGLDIKTMRVSDNKKPNFTPNWANKGGNRQQVPYRGRTTTDGTGRGGQQQRDRMHNKRPPVVRPSIERVQRVTLPSSKDAWKPDRQKTAEAVASEEAAVIEVCKKVRSLMNKVTPTSQRPLTEEFISYNVSSNDAQLAQVVEIVFDKAVEEPKFCALYAEMCKAQANHELSQTGGKSAFRNKVLTRTQMTFQDKKDIDADKLAIIEKEEDPVKKELMLAEEKQKFRRRKFGVMTFMGYLYRNQLLSTKIVQTCTFELFNSIKDQDIKKEDVDEESIHCGLQLIETVGVMLDKSKDSTTVFLDQWFQKLEAAKPYCSNKIRFMIMNLMELRKDKWIPRKSTESGPKKIDEIHKDIRQEKIENEKARDQYDRDRDRRHGGVRPNSNSLRKSVPVSRNSLDRNRGMQHPEQKRAAAAANTKLASSSVQPKNISLSSMDNNTLGKSKKEWHSGASGGGNTSSESAVPVKSAWGRRDSNDQRKKSTVDEKQAALAAAKEISAMSISSRRSTSQNSNTDKTDDELTEEEKAVRAKIMNTVKSDLLEMSSGELSQKELVDSITDYVGKEKYGSPSLTVVYEMIIRAVIEKGLKDDDRKKLAIALRMSLVSKTEKQAFIEGATRFCKFANDVELQQDYPKLWTVTGEVLVNTSHAPHDEIGEVESFSLADMKPIFSAAKGEGNKKFDLLVQVLKQLIELELEVTGAAEGISWEFSDMKLKTEMEEGLSAEMEAVTFKNGKTLSSYLTGN